MLYQTFLTLEVLVKANAKRWVMGAVQTLSFDAFPKFRVCRYVATVCPFKNAIGEIETAPVIYYQYQSDFIKAYDIKTALSVIFNERKVAQYE